MTIAEITEKYTQLKAKRDLIKADLLNKQAKVAALKSKNDAQIKARWVLTEVAQQTQQRFQEKVDTLVTMAIRSVFDRPFEFHLLFERKRNKMECKPIIREGDRVYDDPEYDLGGGILDVISFAFRIVLWSLQNPRSRNVIILDEPMKNMGKLISLGGQVLKEISHQLNLQLIIVTHDEELVEIGDAMFKITHDGSMSHVGTVKRLIVSTRDKEKESDDATGIVGAKRPRKARIVR